MKRLLFAFMFFSITSIFSAAQVDAVLKDTSAKEASSSKLFPHALVLTKDIKFKNHGYVKRISNDNKFAVCVFDVNSGLNFGTVEINLVDISTGDLLWKIHHNKLIWDVQISKNNRFILIRYGSDLYEVIDFKNGSLIYAFNNDQRCHFSNDGRFLIFTHRDNTIGLIDLNTKKVSFFNIPGRYGTVLFTPDDKVITLSKSAKYEYKIVMTDLQGKEVKTISLGLKTGHLFALIIMFFY